MAFKKTSGSKKPVPRITAWSMSRLRDYETCPRMAKYKHVDRMKDGGSAAMDRGTNIHAAAEQFVSNRIKDLHEELTRPKIKKLITVLRKEFKERKVRTELDLALNRKWQRCDWMAPDVYVRVKIDVLRLLPPKKGQKLPGDLKAGEAHVIDWKTGKLREHGEYDDQLNQYATAALSAGYAAKSVGQIAFTDQNVVLERPKGILTLDDLAKNQKAWDDRVLPMMNDTTFAPRPGSACRYCPFSLNKEGPCDY